MKEYNVVVREPIGISIMVGGRMVRTPFSARVSEKELDIIKNKIRSFCVNEDCYEIKEILDFNDISNINQKVKITEKRIKQNVIVEETKIDETNDVDQDVLQKLMNNNFEDFDIEEL